MKMLSGYIKNDVDNVVNTQYDIAINSCGRYELVKQKQLKTHRTGGRADFQVLYVAKGTATFTLNDEDQVFDEGTIVLYLPGEDQFYYYTNETSPIIYWLHFSGYNALKLLEENGMINGRHFFVGIKIDLSTLFDKIIVELQFGQGKYFELCNLYIKELVTLCSRYVIESTHPTSPQNKVLEDAIEYFNENFNTAISIKEYANDCNISCCWFIRSFKSYTGTTPIQYITNIRINKAKNLLHDGSLTIGEIGNLIGYQNPLYFSRIFKKNVGLAPMCYKKK
jgi:AraC family transcriptional regulator of arabinose operon